MAYVVRRPRGRWEIRESFATPRGPRARTLASFSELSEDVIARAVERSQTGAGRDDVIRSARLAGVPFAADPADRLAEELVRLITRNHAPRRGLRSLLHEHLERAGLSDEQIDGSLADWIGASPEERGAALVDLLGLADRLPNRQSGPLSFPGFVSNTLNVHGDRPR